MSEKYNPPPGPPPNYQTTTNISNPSDAQHGRQQRVSWTTEAGPNSQQRELASNNPYREGSLSIPPGPNQRPSSSSNIPSQSHTPHHVLTPRSTGSTHSDAKDVEMGDDEYAPPPGPPPARAPVKVEYDPPAGPPPGWSPAIKREQSEAPPAYDPWLGPEDLPPPPTFQHMTSPTANADYDDAAKAHQWCRQTRLWPAVEHDDSLAERIERGDLRLTVPPNTTDITQYQPALGRSYIRTTSSVGDTILLSDIPIYASYRQSPLASGRPLTLYFEIKVLGLGDRYNPNKQVESGVAIGFVAPPYPAWRLPGWHRGSLGVHSDDGRRYVDNSYGGHDFTGPFKKGDTVGIGMTYSPPVHGDRVSMRCEVFFTRNGKRDGSWNLHEEQDRKADSGDIRGLEGEFDLLAAVGVFGAVELETVFRREEWLYRP